MPRILARVKVDLKKEIPSYAARKGRFDVVEVPPLQYLAIDGAGDPNTSAEYRDAVEALFPVAYRLKFFSKKELGRDYGVMPLEALWWADDMGSFTSSRDKSAWSWTLLNLVPSWITAEHLPEGPVRLETVEEGLCVQTLHVGPFDDEGPVLAEMHDEVVPAKGMRMTGRHHEIYFSDIRRAAPEKWRTILRQPVERV